MRIAIVADRVGWEESQLLAAAKHRDVEAFWLDDSGLCVGPGAATVAPADVYLMRGRSYTRGSSLAGLLADAGRWVVNSPAAITACQDKLITARLLVSAGVPVPEFRLVLSRKDLGTAIDELGLPCVFKPLFGGLGRRVLLIRDRDLASAAYDYVEHFGQSFDRVLLAQRFCPGIDMRVFIVGTDIVAVYERAADGDWRANVAVGGAVRPMRAGSEAATLALTAANAVGADVCAVDLLAGEDGTAVVNEVNHVPRFHGAVQATGCDIGGAILDHLLRAGCLARMR